MADDKREQLLEGIRGQTISIPNLRPVFEEWRMTNKNHHAVKPVLNPWIERYGLRADCGIHPLTINEV